MNKRLHELDSLRGLASVAVMLGHFSLVFPLIENTRQPDNAAWWLKIAKFSPLHVIWEGHQAVIFFFILSGFVLALIFLGKGGAPPLPLYLVKRVARIYPPYLVAVLSALILREAVYRGPLPLFSNWFNSYWKNPVTPEVIQGHLLMIGSFKNCDFDPVLWSLVHEMRISLVFPLIIWGIVKREQLCLALPLVFTLLYWLSSTFKYLGIPTFLQFATLHYSGFFIVGAFLAKYRAQVAKTVQALSASHKWLLLGGAILAYSNSDWLPYYGTPKIGLIALTLRDLCFQEWMTTVGVVVVISLAISSKYLSVILAARPLQYLGAISYSLYLLHAIVLKVLVTVLIPYLPIAVVVLISIAVSLLVSTASWRYIEIPSISLGKRIAKWAVQKNLVSCRGE